MRISQDNLADVVMVDIAKGLAEGKGLDIDDAASLLKYKTSVVGTDDFSRIANSDIVVITAGFARKPGESRQDLLKKNSQLIKDISSQIKKFSPSSLIIVVTNPVDILTYQVYKDLGVDRKRIIGLGLSLDASRFANLIAKELKVSVLDIEPVVVATHNEKMLPSSRFTLIKGRPLSELLGKEKIKELIDKTRNRGVQIVACLGLGSAYVAPSAAIFRMVKAILTDEKQKTLGSVILNGEYSLKDICFGVPVIIGKAGIEKIIELELNAEEKQEFLSAAEEIRQCMISA